LIWFAKQNIAKLVILLPEGRNLSVDLLTQSLPTVFCEALRSATVATGIFEGDTHFSACNKQTALMNCPKCFQQTFKEKIAF
jgi:hypothetical protein